MSEKSRPSSFPLPRSSLAQGRLESRSASVTELRRAIVQARERTAILQSEIVALREVSVGLDASEAKWVERIDVLTKDCDELAGRLDRARARAKEVGAECQSLLADNSALEASLEAIGARSTRLADRIAALEADLGAKSEVLQTAQAGLRQSVGSVARMNFRMGKKVRGGEEASEDDEAVAADRRRAKRTLPADGRRRRGHGAVLGDGEVVGHDEAVGRARGAKRDRS